jgi:hydroxymethylglutaryl-CoA lyase
MAGSDEVMAQINRVDGVTYSALVPNAKGAELAIAARADELELVVSASETHNEKNVRRSVVESLVGARDVVELAHAAGIQAEAIVSTSFGCPYEGDIEPPRVAQLAGHLVDAGADRLSFGDTTGMATPRRVHELLDALERAGILAGRVGLHFHDTRGTALANVLASLPFGITTYDASSGGLGGCPYAPGATGNLATEDLLYMLDGLGIETGVSLEKVLAASRAIEAKLGHPLASRYAAASAGQTPSQRG